MRILHVITGLQKAAGTSVFAGEVASEQVRRGCEVTIAVLNPNAADCYPLDSRVKLVSIAEVLGAFHFSVVHIHALWAPILSKVAKVARKAGATVIWSPHGMLTPWALKNKWWKKFVALAFYQWWALHKADVLHATAQSEIEDIRRVGLRNRVVIAPLGVKINTVERFDRGAQKILLFVSRVQRKKGLPNLLAAWARLPVEARKGWMVRIVGPDQDNHTAELKAQCAALGLRWGASEGEVVFVGPKYGEELTREYASADLFVLPTHSENFGSVVIESLAQGVPVICTKGAPWEELVTQKCGWWIDIGVEPLVAALQEAMACVVRGESIEMGRNGRALVERKYSWSAVVDELGVGP